MSGDVRALGPADRVALLRQLVDEANLAWGAAPPVILVSAEGGKLVPYITKAGADQLAKVQGVSLIALDIVDNGVGVVDVVATARSADGRQNIDSGSCHYDPDVPATRSRARMVASTRARRRTILGLLGSGFAWSQQGDVELGLEDPEA